MSDEDLLTRLVALNAARAAEERRGQIRWLRPAFQNAAGTATQTGLDTDTNEAAAVMTAPAASKGAWPKTLAEQVQAVRATLAAAGAPTSAEMLAKAFKGGMAERVEDILETLASLGHARKIQGQSFVAM